MLSDLFFFTWLPREEIKDVRCRRSREAPPGDIQKAKGFGMPRSVGNSMTGGKVCFVACRESRDDECEAGIERLLHRRRRRNPDSDN